MENPIENKDEQLRLSMSNVIVAIKKGIKQGIYEFEEIGTLFQDTLILAALVEKELSLKKLSLKKQNK